MSKPLLTWDCSHLEAPCPPGLPLLRALGRTGVTAGRLWQLAPRWGLSFPVGKVELAVGKGARGGWRGLRAHEKASLHWPPEAEPACRALDMSPSLRPSSWHGEGVAG